MLVQNFQSSVATTHTHTQVVFSLTKKKNFNSKEKKLFSSFGYVPKDTPENIFQCLVTFFKIQWKIYNLLLSQTFSSPKHIYKINK